MAAKNPDSMTDKQGEFHPSKPRAEPMTTKGHQIGTKVSEDADVPVFSAKTLPPGSAPQSRTFKPNPQSDIPSQANNPDVLGDEGKESTYTPASSTLVGADSRSVHKGLGLPAQGQTSTEVRHDGQHHRKRDGAGLEGVGASGDKGINDPAYNPPPDDDHEVGPLSARKHNVTLPGAEDMLPESAGSFPSERQQKSK